ncbi:MAG: glycosyltransferase [Rubrivivax sp.]
MHDWLVDFAGSERVLEQILALFPDATLYTLIDRMPAPERNRLPSRATRTSWLQRLPRVERYFTRCLPLMPLAMQQFDLSGHDLVISSSHCVAKGVIVPPEALHLCYCHSPMRYAWDMQGEYLHHEGLDHGIQGWLARRMFHRLRQWDATSHQGVDHFAANSHFVRQRILKCYRRPATVIHPPVALPAEADSSGVREAGHYVTVGRLMGYKNVGLMLDAFRLLPELRLTVVGDGPQRRALQSRAPGNVHFAGALPEADKQQLLQQATAFVFAAVEDFGIAPVEALAAGTPVVARARGGALDYLQHGDNAWLFDAATPEGLAQALLQSAAAWPADVADRCRRSAAGFAATRFRSELAHWVETHWTAWRAGAAPTA